MLLYRLCASIPRFNARHTSCRALARCFVSRWGTSGGMLRVAATLLALLAALPAVTPLLGGYKAFSSTECRNLTHLGPGKWPETPSKPYYFTGLLVMPGDTCTGSLVAANFFLSSSLCRLWKGEVTFKEDIEDAGSEVRMGLVQGDIPHKLNKRQLVKQYLHFGKELEEVLENPVMLVELEEGFECPESLFPGIFKETPLSTRNETSIIVGDVVGYEHSLNMPLYHQAAFDVHLHLYHVDCKEYGRTQWNISEDAICTWDVSPVRTVCNIDRGGPVVVKKHILGVIVGFVDDVETPSNYCGEGRIHYNIFLQMEKYVPWITEKTGGKVKVVNLVDGRVIEECEEEAKPGAPAKPGGKTPPPRRTTKKPEKGRSGAETQMPSAVLLLLPAAATIARLLSQC